jgi:hypothetical protein
VPEMRSPARGRIFPPRITEAVQALPAQWTCAGLHGIDVAEAWP